MNASKKIHGYLAHHRESFVMALQRFAEHWLSGLMTVIVIGVVVALPLGLRALVDNLSTGLEGVVTTGELTVFLPLGSDLSAAQLLATEISRAAEFGEGAVVTPDQALEEFKELAGIVDGSTLLSDNPLPFLVRFSLQEGSHEPQEIAQRVKKLQQDPRIELAHFDDNWLSRLQSLEQVLKRLLLVITVLFSLGVIFVVGNTMRLAIDTRREEICVVKLIGGSRGFVRRPFLYSGLLLGLSGGLSSILLVWLGVVLMRGPVNSLVSAYGVGFEFLGPGVVATVAAVVGSALLGLAGAWVAVARQIALIDYE